ncbi:helix-turn-helix domain-containing protein [Chryseobacterium sp. POE27]|uniref:helix-turn-helix domain-containing protein n=1 Tax=Chryseobacterium sp. POE27 TaxID=3138177 RepID=UPI00321C2A3C
MERSVPNYRKIYEDIISRKCPEKYNECAYLLNKNEIMAMDVLKLNEIIFGTSPETEINNRRHKNYDYHSIIRILEYQKEKGLSNIEVSRHFNLSRSTVSRWRKTFSC